MTVTDNCERQQFGKYKPGRARGRCNDDDLNEWAAEVRKRSFCFWRRFLLWGLKTDYHLPRQARDTRKATVDVEKRCVSYETVSRDTAGPCVLRRRQSVLRPGDWQHRRDHGLDHTAHTDAGRPALLLARVLRDVR